MKRDCNYFCFQLQEQASVCQAAWSLLADALRRVSLPCPHPSVPLYGPYVFILTVCWFSLEELLRAGLKWPPPCGHLPLENDICSGKSPKYRVLLAKSTSSSRADVGSCLLRSCQQLGEGSAVVPVGSSAAALLCSESQCILLRDSSVAQRSTVSTERFGKTGLCS